MAHFVANIQPSLSEISHHETTPQHHGGHRPAHQPHPAKQSHHHPHPSHSSSQLFEQSRMEYKDNEDEAKTAKHSDGNTAFLRAARAGHLDKVLEQLKNNVDINTSNANGLNALHLASKDGHMSVVSELLKRGANVDSATKKGNTALHIASLAGQEEVVKHLVEHGACVNVQSQNGFTPLYMAAQENHDSVVKFLLANGANQSLATEDGFTPLAVAMQQGHDKVVAVLLENDTRGKVRLPALHIAAKKDDCKAAALLLQNEHNPDVTSKSGFTPLHIASHYGNEGIANLLLSKGADVNFAAKHNITPLHVAAKWGKANMVSTLLSRGANIEAKTRDGLTPLHCAARSGHEQVVDMLLERGAPISAKTKNGLAALHMSSQGDHVDAARILLYHRAPVDDVTVDYLTALHVAAHCGHVGVARLLLDRKADPNARALNGFTPLHIACKKNRIKVVELLLKHGASIEATTESGLTPLHVASFMGCMNIVIYLVQNEAGPDVTTVRGETPLHLAARANQTDIIRILLRNDAQVDARAREQQTPLHIASRLGNVDIVMLLLQHGASVDSTTKDLYTALHIAAKEGQDEVASVLLENGASLEATTKKGFTPLHLAAKYGHMNVAKLLLRRDAPVDAQGKNGVTPLHVASHYDHQNVALLLLEKGASPHATAKNGHTPLHIAARKNQMDIATTLLEYGAKANAESKAGFTPLHLSAQEGHADMSNLLIEHQADINHKAKNGLTPLHLCAQEDCVEVGTILLKNNAQVNCTTKAGYTPLHVASHFGQMGMVRLLLSHGANVTPTTAVNYTPLHQAAQQGHSGIVNALLEAGANPNATTNQGQTALSIAQKLGYISVVESLKGVTDTPISPTSADEKYKVVAPETMQETFMSDSEDEGGDVLGLEYGFTPAHPHVYLPYFQGDSIFTREETMLSEQPYHYLTVDEMKGLGDDSLPIDVTRDERDNRDMGPPTAIDDTISPQHIKESYSQFTTADNVDITKHPLHVGKLQWRNFLVSFLVDARGGAMRGCRHSGVRVIVPPRRASMPLRVTCRYLKRDKLPHPPPLMEGEALASRILELGPVGAKFLGPVMIEVPHFGSLRGKEREIVILRSDNGETWREHTFEATEEAIHDVLSHSFEKDEINQVDDSGRTTRILTTEFPHYIAVVSRVRQEVHAIGPEGGMVSSTVVPQVQAVFPHGALTKKIKVGLQAQPIPTELTAKLLGNRVAVSPIVTVEPRRRKFHKPISLTIPVPQAANKGMINQYSGDAPTLRLLCSITGGTTRAQWEDVTGSTPLTFVNDCVSFTTTVSARFWLMDCRNISEATKMATELYREAIHVPFMAKFVVFAKRVDTTEARLRVFCMTDDKEDKTLEHQEHFTEVAKSRDVEVLEGKMQYLEFAGNLVPVTKSGEQLQLGFRAFKENRLPFTGRVKDPHADALGRIIFMREPKVAKGDAPQQPICILNIVLPEEIIPDSDLHDQETPKHSYITHTSGLQRLSDISNLLGEDWVKLANELDISTSEINSIKTELCDLSEAQQGFALLRLWLQSAGNKATASALEKGLRNIGRDDIIQQTVFSMDQTDPYVLSEDLSPSYTTCHNVFRKTITVQKEIITDKRKEGKQIPVKDAIDKHDHDEKKYSAEEKEVEEELHKSVSERKKEIEKRLSQDFDDKKKEKFTTKETKTIEESMKTSIKTAEKDKKLLDELGEKEIAEEKAVSPEPAHLSFDEKRKSFEMGITPKEKIKQLENLQKFIKEEQSMAQETVTVVQREKSVEKGVVEEESLSFQEKRLSFEQGLAMKKPGDKLPSSETQKDVSETKVTTEFTKVDEKHTADYRRDSELFEEVSQGLGKLKTGVIKAQPQDLLSPMVVKTPPPSPAEFSKEPPDNKKWSSDIQTSLLSGEGERHTTETTKEAIDPKKILREGIEEKTISKEIKQEILTKDAEDKKETKQDSATDVSKHLTEKLLASERPKDETVKEEVEEKFKKDANFTDMSDQDLLIDEGVSEDVEISFSVEEDGTSEKYEYSDDDTSPTKPYITTPTQTRRNTGIGGSQRLSQGERPTVRVVTDFLVDAYESDEEENYMVTEPYERPQEAKRNIKIRFSPDLYDDDEKKPSIEEVKEADKCEASRNVEKVEKCFERMASKTKEADPKESVHTEGEFEKMVSQLSLEEVDQALHQWEAGGLTPSDIDSKEITVSSEEISPSQQESSHTPEREESGEIPPIPSPRVPVKPQDFSTTPKSPSIELSENETYTTKKMFWEQISSGSTETMPEKETPPVPKPRKSLTSSTVSSDVMKSVQSSYSDASGKLEASDIDEDSLNVQSTTTTEKVVAGFTKEPSLSLEGDNSEIEYIKAHELEELSYDNDAFNLCETDEVQALPKHRKPIYERSVSLPCDSSIENSNVRAKKRVFEAQIKKEMVVEQLMAQLEEESSPEHKSIEQKTKPPTPNAQAMVSRQIHSDIFSNELEEQIEFHIPENKEIVEKVVSSSIQKVDEMHDSKTEISAIVKEHKESYDSTLSTNVQEALQYKADAISKPSDSLEVHVDKSELEDSEKEKEIDEEIKTMKGLKEAGVPMPSVSDKEKFGSLTSSQGESEDTFSESDVTPEDARFKENQEITDWALSEKNGKLNLDAEDTIKQRIVYTPEEHIPDTVWEVPVQEEVEAMEEETVQFPTSESKSVTISSIKEVVMSESEARKIAENVVDEIESKLLHCEGVTKTINVEDDFEMVEKHSEIRSSIDLSEPLSRKSDQIMKLMRTDTTTSSMEITDEDLRSSGVETDNSPLESQAGRLEPLDEGNDSSDDVDNQELDQEPFGKEVVEKTLAEVKQSLEAVKEELIEEKKKKKDSITKESPSEFEFKSVSLENTFNETIQECHHEEMSSVQTYKQSFETQIINESLIKDLESRTEKESESTKDLVKDKEQEFLSKSEEVAVEKTTQKTLQEVQSNVEMKVEESVVTETTEKLLRDNTKIKFTADTLDSSDSPVSETKPEDRRSPVQDEGGSTSSSSEQKFGSDGAEIGSSFVTRKHKKTHVTVKQDQKSDCELYSSSGESHYQSFEQTSDSIKTPGSRPLSSDIEGLVANMSGATGSSEYESAISHEISGHSTTITSKEYHTAVSSLSSRDSMKSLDSESSGNLASVEVSSEASETLVPSAMELEKDTDGESVMAKSGKQSHKVEEQIKMQSFSESIEQSVSFDISTEDLSEEEVPVLDQESSARMKRSHEMTFQPEPRPIIAETDINKSLEDKFMASIEDVSSLVSSLDTTALNTVVELSKTESARMDGSGTSEQLSLTVSATSEAFSISDSKEQEEVDTVVSKVESVSTQSPSLRSSDLLESVTITTSSVVEQGVQSVCTQVTSKTTSHSNGPTQVDYVPEYDEGEPEVKKRGHRRNGSTSFRPSMIPVFHTRQVEKKKSEDIAEDTAESDKYSESLTLKEGAQEEKKDIDEAERLEEEFYQTEADQGLHRDIREGRVVLEDTYVHDDIKSYDYDISASVSKSRLPSAAFSDDHADSELAELLKQCSTDIITEDPIERPKTPEPIEECEIKDDTPEFSSEAQASVTELEMEYSGAFSRTSEYEAHISPIREKGMMPYESLEQVEHEQELTEAEAAFHSGLPDTSLPKTIFEKSIVEKHELETQELSLKEEPTDTKLRSSPVPGITITQHVSQTLKDSFDNLEGPVTPLPSSAIPDKEKQEVSSEKCFTFTEDKYQELLADEPFPSEDTSADLRQESKDESMTDSPTSDSFEILEKPDIADEFVIIEEVAKEAEEQDTEGKGILISQARPISRPYKQPEEDEILVSPPTTTTKLTKLKYYSGGNEEDILFDFDSGSPSKKEVSEEKVEASSTESSPPVAGEQDFKPEVEAGKKWMEMQFQGEPVAPIYGYDIEFERGPLEDIKEEDINDLESSSKIGSMGSQVSHSIGSFGSVKASLSSTPDYDVLAGRKFFTRSGEHDDVSMSSLQEFERLENLIALESTKHRSLGSQDSLTSSSNSRKHGRSAGDDISLASLKEFEGLESACIAAEHIEKKAKAEEESLLSEIEEGHESQTSESESCTTVSAGGINRAESDEDDYERRMFEIDEIIRQAQTNVEQFMGQQKDFTESGIKCETLGRADSIEEISKVPELDLDQPVSYSSGKSYIQHWEDLGEDLLTSTDSLEVKTQISKTSIADPFTTSTDSLELKISHDVMSISTDSIEASQKDKKKDIMTDSIEMGDKRANVTSTDSLEGKVTQASSIDEDEQQGAGADQSSSSGKEGDLSSGKEDSVEGAVGMTTNRMPPPRAEFLLGSTDSLEPTSSTATHATYHYETDSVMSSSFTSGDSTTMVDDNEEDAARASYWFDEGKPYVTEVIEPIIGDDEFPQMIHRTVEMPPEICKITFKGEDAEKGLREYIEKFDPGEDVTETREVDKDGNVHIKRIIQKRVVIRPEELGGDTTNLTGSDLQKYLQSLTDAQIGSTSPLLETFQISSPIESQTSITTIQRTTTSSQVKGETVKCDQQPKETEIPHRGSRPPLKYDISVDEDPEYDPREHDWRFNLHTHLEGEEETQGFASGSSVGATRAGKQGDKAEKK
ncbi:ankyrin-2-like isoform X13 [Cimex lectularius]|uniref:Uncharacterized protein n=1 Tax=Cimex lectularius TaxID=79782 RepID=A0A8I6TMB4_CIMLE|nr:ankyrin-2-like isoform X13 [Cimex lectularius]